MEKFLEDTDETLFQHVCFSFFLVLLFFTCSRFPNKVPVPVKLFWGALMRKSALASLRHTLEASRWRLAFGSAFQEDQTGSTDHAAHGDR
jgi:hypothetical protein